MANWLKFVIALASAFVLMLCFRTLVFSIHGVTGHGLPPVYDDGDRLLINRCSYGMRIEGNGLLPYTRLLRQPVQRGDIVAFTIPGDSIEGLMIARCVAVPGDTLPMQGGTVIVPGLKDCADADYYWLESVNRKNLADSRHFGFIPERNILGKVMTVLYNNHDLRLP